MNEIKEFFFQLLHIIITHSIRCHRLLLPFSSFLFFLICFPLFRPPLWNCTHINIYLFDRISSDDRTINCSTTTVVVNHRIHVDRTKVKPIIRLRFLVCDKQHNEQIEMPLLNWIKKNVFEQRESIIILNNIIKSKNCATVPFSCMHRTYTYTDWMEW